MTMRKTVLSIGAMLYLFVTFQKSHEIVASLASLGSYCLLILGEFSPVKYWREGLAEWWIASIVWLTAGIVVARHLVKKWKSPQQEGQPTSIAVTIIASIGFMALTAPIIAPLDPNLQGQLTTTRLLPPMSAGTAIQSTQDYGINVGVQGLFEKSSNSLLFSHMTIVGDNSSVSEPDAKTQRVFFLFGTDDIGRDVFSRVIYGSRASLIIGILAALGSVGIGTLIGFVAGYTNRALDAFFMRLTDLALAIPSLFLLITVMAFLGKSIPTLILILSLTGWMSIARTVRTEVLRLREREFVLAAKLLNQSPWQILQKHIIPNLKPILTVAAILQFGNVILAEASLSFLGLGIQPPTASWGNMLWQSLSSLRSSWWLGIFPGAMLAVVLVTLQHVADSDKRAA